MANTLGIPGILDDLTRVLTWHVQKISSLEFVSGLKQWFLEKRSGISKKIGKFGGLKQLKQLKQPDVFFFKRWIFTFHPFMWATPCDDRSRFKNLRWGMLSSASVLRRCQTLVPLPSFTVNCWWRTTGKLMVKHFKGMIGSMTPNKKCKHPMEGELWKVNLLKVVCWSHVIKPHTNTHTQSHTYSQRLVFGWSFWWTYWSWPPTLLENNFRTALNFPLRCTFSRMTWHVLLRIY